MDKVFSTRLDEALLDQLNRACRRLGISKKQFLQEAIRLRTIGARAGGDSDIWAETCGAWRRGEPPATTIRRARRAFAASMARHVSRPGR
jgi:hypothetical protein